MNSDKPNFLSQPVVKNIVVYRNGDPYYEGRRLVINERRVSNFETFLKEVTGGVQAPFGAVRTIYTPKAGHRVSELEHLQSGEQYVAAGKERFKKLDYLQIGAKKKKMLSNAQVKPVPQSRIIVSARFLKPIREPCTIFILANGDVRDPAIRFLIPQRILVQYARVLEMVTERMGLRVLGGVHSLYTLDGTLVNEGKDLESGQFYVAVGREKFKKLPYSELIFNKPIGSRRLVGSKAASLPPIYRFRKQNGNVARDQSKSIVSKSEAEDPKLSPLQKEHLASIVNEMSQARLLKLRQKKGGMSMSLGGQSNDDGEQGATEDPGESGGSSNQEAHPPEGSKDDAPAEEISEEVKDTSEDRDDCPEVVTNATAKDDGDKKPSENGADGPSTSQEEQKEEKNTTISSDRKEKSEDKSDSPSSNEKNKEKHDNSTSDQGGKETDGKSVKEKEEQKPEDSASQAGEQEAGRNGTEESPPAAAISNDQGEGGQERVVEDKAEQEKAGQERVVEDKAEQEKAGSSETKKKNAEEEEKPSDQIQEDSKKKGEEGSGGQKGSEKVDQGEKKEK